MKPLRIVALATLVTIAGAETGPSAHAMGFGNGAMCDGFMDCIYTAYWYAFLR